jgi:phage protein U
MTFDPIPFFRKQIFAKLGGFSFELQTLTPERIERETEYRWVRQDPLGAAPIQQFLGDKKGRPHEERMTISGVSHPAFTGSFDQLKKLRDMAAAGKPLRLIYADTKVGENLGLWIIRKIKEGRSIFIGEGVPLKVEFTIELDFYG